MSGRRERFERLYDSCYAPVLGYVRRRTDSIHDARDVVSETFVTAWRRLDDIPDGDRARLWLFGTARKVVKRGRRTLPKPSSPSRRLQPAGKVRLIVGGMARSEQGEGLAIGLPTGGKPVGV